VHDFELLRLIILQDATEKGYNVLIKFVLDRSFFNHL